MGVFKGIYQLVVQQVTVNQGSKSYHMIQQRGVPNFHSSVIFNLDFENI